MILLGLLGLDVRLFIARIVNIFVLKELALFIVLILFHVTVLSLYRLFL